MKKKEILEDLEIYVDPKPLTEDEGIALSLFIRQLKAKKAQRPTAPPIKNAGNGLRHQQKR